MYLKTERMALTLLKDADLKKGVVPVVSNEPVTGMKETTVCRCRQIPCTCVRNIPIDFNIQSLISPAQMFSAERLNRFAIQALIARDPYATEFYGQNWPGGYDPVVSSSDQRSHKEPSPAPPSPPISTSSPLSNGSSTDSNKVRGKKYTCNTCQRSFDYKHVLQNHERTHTGEKPFACPECQKRFTRDHHLKTHMRLHTGEKPYHCKHCDRQFVQVANLRRHTRVHTGERPYACAKCESRFSDSNQLKAHMLIHSDQKPFSCVFCKGRYRRKHHLNNHKCVKGKRYVKVEEDEVMSDVSSSDSRMSDGYTKYHQPWVPTVQVADSEALNLTKVISLPVQTEPEDLSIKKYSSTNNNNSSGSAACDSSRSSSPMEVDFRQCHI